MKLKQLCRFHGLLLYFLKHKGYDVLLKLPIAHSCTVKQGTYEVAYLRFLLLEETEVMLLKREMKNKAPLF